MRRTWSGHVTTFQRHRVTKAKIFFSYTIPGYKTNFLIWKALESFFASPCTIFTPGKPQILSRKQAAVLNSTCLFLAVFTFIPITYVTRYKKNRWHSCSEPTYHSQMSSQLSLKTLRFLDENCRSREKKWRKFVPSYINVRYTVKKITWIWTSVLL